MPTTTLARPEIPANIIRGIEHDTRDVSIKTLMIDLIRDAITNLTCYTLFICPSLHNYCRIYLAYNGTNRAFRAHRTIISIHKRLIQAGKLKSGRTKNRPYYNLIRAEKILKNAMEAYLWLSTTEKKSSISCDEACAHLQREQSSLWKQAQLMSGALRIQKLNCQAEDPTIPDTSQIELFGDQYSIEYYSTMNKTDPSVSVLTCILHNTTTKTRTILTEEYTTVTSPEHAQRINRMRARRLARAHTQDEQSRFTDPEQLIIETTYKG